MGAQVERVEQPKPILRVKCEEPDGEVVRSVRLCRLTIDKLNFLWKKLSEFDVLFNDFTRGSFEAFVDHFLVFADGDLEPAGLIWEVDDVGLFFMNEIRPAESASAHFVFWDQRFRGRAELCRQMVKYVMERYLLQRLELRVPLYAYHTLNAVEKIGFIKEGRLRNSVLYKEKWFDVNVYSIIPSDIGLESKEDESDGTADANS